MSKVKENFQDVVDTFSLELENGGNPFYSPKQFGTKEYKGFNQFNLGYVVRTKHYSQNEWFTFKQISELGGKVNKGEKSTPVFLYSKSWLAAFSNGTTKWINATTKEDALKEANKVGKVISIKEQFVLKSWYVFNREQTTLEQKEPTNFQKLQEIKDCYHLNGTQDFEMLQKAVFDEVEGDIEFFEKKAVAVIGASFLLCSLHLPQEPIAPELIEIIVNKLKQSPNAIWKWARLATESVDKIIKVVERCAA